MKTTLKITFLIVLLFKLTLNNQIIQQLTDSIRNEVYSLPVPQISNVNKYIAHINGAADIVDDQMPLDGFYENFRQKYWVHPPEIADRIRLIAYTSSVVLKSFVFWTYPNGGLFQEIAVGVYRINDIVYFRMIECGCAVSLKNWNLTPESLVELEQTMKYFAYQKLKNVLG